MQFEGNVKSVTVNVAKKTISISFQVQMNEANMKTAENLAFHVDKAPVVLAMNPMQTSLPEPPR